MNQPLPDYQCAGYRRQVPLWTYLDALYVGDSAWLDRSGDGSVRPNSKAQVYLPKFSREAQSDYVARLLRTPYSDRFAAALRDFIGLIFHNPLAFSEDFPPILHQHFSNLDQQGNEAVVLFSQMALAAMRRGHTFVLIDCPTRLPGQVSLADAQVIRPYWVHIQPHQVLSWRTVIHNSQRQLSQVVIQQSQLVPDGEFGEQEEISYLVLRPGRYDTYTIEVNPQNKSQRRAIHHPQRSGLSGIIRGNRVEPLPFIPLICLYGGLQTGVFESQPPLKTLADLNATHYQLYSDHLSKIHYCCFPVAVRTGVMAEEEDLILGPGAVVDAPPGGGFLWVEPSASSFAESRREIEALELAMDFLGTQYLVKPSDRQAAQVSLIQAAKVESSLELFARAFTQGLNQALAIHCAYLGLPAASLKLDTQFFQQSADPNQLQGLVHLVDRLISLPPSARQLLLTLAQRKGYLPTDLDLAAMLSQLPTPIQEETHA